MNFLGAMGGIGAGLMGAQKILRDQDEMKQRKAESDLRTKLLQQGIDEINRKLKNDADYGEIANGDLAETDGQSWPSAAQPPVSAAKMAARGLSRVGEPLPIMPDIAPAGGATATEGAAGVVSGAAAAEAKPAPKGAMTTSMRQTFQKMANAAISRGDADNYKKFTDFVVHAKKADEEGIIDVAKMIHFGNVNPAEAERAFNAAGSLRVVPGTAKWDETTGTLTGVDASTGQPVSMNKDIARQYLVMSGAIKPEEYLSSGDGQVFNKRTGEAKGAARRKPIVVNGTVFEQQDDGNGGIIYKKVAEAPRQPSVVIRQGGDSLTTPQQRTNAEIDAAREYIAGMPTEEIRRRTQQYSTTGRDNPDYDPLLAAKVRQANHRKYGDDPSFGQAGQQTEQQQPNHQQRFAADPAMKGMRLGARADRGFEVFDANGKLIGYFN